MLSIRRRWWGVALAGGLLTLALAPGATLADATPQNATVTITDAGFSPAKIAVPVDGTVTWVNHGSNVHSATTTGTPENGTEPATFDTGGIGPGQTGSWFFTLPGTYIYSSSPDCLHGNQVAAFSCNIYTVTVGAATPAPPQPVASNPGLPLPSPTPAIAPAGPVPVLQSASVSISDTGFSPAAVTIASGGSVTFTNHGSMVHTASQITAPAGGVLNTGGLATGQSQNDVLTVAGIYTYSSATDCLNGNVSAAFNCTGAYSITVTNAPVGATTAAVVPAFSASTIQISASGFSPNPATISAGQTVTWLNLDSATHSVVSDDASPPFDSGGLSSGSTFTVAFPKPGTYHYHDSTQPNWGFDQAGQPYITGYKTTGTIVVK